MTDLLQGSEATATSPASGSRSAGTCREGSWRTSCSTPCSSECGRSPAAAILARVGARWWGVAMTLGMWDHFRGPITEDDVDEQLRRGR